MINVTLTREDAISIVNVLKWASNEISGPLSAFTVLHFERAGIFCAELSGELNRTAVPAEIGTGRGQWDRPEHYGGEENPFEPIKIIEHYDLNFNLGNVIKYVLRASFKGTPLADLKKAYTYLGFEIRRRERLGEGG